MAFKLLRSDYDQFFEDWISDLRQAGQPYKEPILSSADTKILREICHRLKLDNTVFIMSVEVLEEYIRRKNVIHQKIDDSLIASLATVFICHKFIGAPDLLKVRHILDVADVACNYSDNHLMATECDILLALNGAFPLSTAVDDLHLIVEKFMGGHKFRASVRPLCEWILEFFYIKRRGVFGFLKNFYDESEDCRTVFRNLMCSKFYVPISILVTALELTDYKNIINIDNILEDVATMADIHGDHVMVMVGAIKRCVDVKYCNQDYEP